MKDPFENWTIADWMNLRLFVPNIEAPLLDDEEEEDIDDEERRSNN